MPKKIGRSGTGKSAVVAALFAVVVLSGYGLTEGVDEEISRNADVLSRLSAASSNLASGDVRHVPDGAELYMTRCMSCHQMNGRGVPGVFPPLSGSDWVTGDKGRLIRIVLNGMTGEMKVGDEVYSGAMPPWQTFLNDEETSQLLTYIRQSWENDTTEVTPEEVAAVREAVAERKQPWTAEELLQETNQGVPGH